MDNQHTDHESFEERQPESVPRLIIYCGLALLALIAVAMMWNRDAYGEKQGNNMPDSVVADRQQPAPPKYFVLDEATKANWCQRIRNTNPCCPGYPDTFRYPRVDTSKTNRDWCNAIGQKNIGCPGYTTWALSRQGMDEECRNYLDWCDRINHINISCPFHE
jgi:hypothetical protein